MRGAEQTGIIGMSAGETAFATAKQFRLQQLGRYRGAIDRDEWLVLARARIVQGARQNFLAGTAGTGDQYSRIGPRDALRVLEHRIHQRAACADAIDRKSVMYGTSVSVRVTLRGGRLFKTKKSL